MSNKLSKYIINKDNINLLRNIQLLNMFSIINKYEISYILYNYKIKANLDNLVFYYRDRKNNKLLFYNSYIKGYNYIICNNASNSWIIHYPILDKYNKKYNTTIYYDKNTSKYSKNISRLGHFIKKYSN